MTRSAFPQPPTRHRLVTLGGLVLLEDGRPVEGAGVRGRSLALLGLLARSGDAGCSRDKLMAFLWPESEAARARHSLDQALYTLRRVLGPEGFVTGPATLALDPRVVASDLAEFRAAVASADVARAIDLYQGDFLDGFHLSNAPELERWVDGERASLRAEFARTVEAAARRASVLADHPGSVALWRRLVALEPIDSRLALGLIDALAAAGDRTGALRAAAAHADLVRRELDLSPDPSIVAAVERLRSEPAPLSAPPRSRAADARLVDPAATVALPADRAGPRRWAFVAGLGVAAALVGAVLVRWGLTDSAPPTRPRVAVAAFVNETGDSTLDPVARMASDWITESLVRTGLVSVIDPDGAAEPAERGIAGRLYRAGDSVWIQARVTDRASGAVVRALESVPATALSPGPALEALRQQVLGALGTLYDPRLSAWADAVLRPPSYAAYREFAAGLELQSAPRELAAAVERFRRAAELDPDYLLPQLWMGWASVLAADWPRADSIIEALAPRRGAMSPLERAWHERIAALLAGDNEASYRAARRMMEIAPRSGWVIALANTALDTNRPAVAAAAIAETGPERLGLEQGYGWFLLTAAYHQLGEYRRELAASDHGIQAVGLGWGMLGPGVAALAAMGRMDELESRLLDLERVALDDHSSDRYRAIRTAVEELRVHGFGDRARALLDRMLDPETTGLSPEPEQAPVSWDRVLLAYEAADWRGAAKLFGRLARFEGDSIRVRALSGLIAARLGDTAGARRVANSLVALRGDHLFGEPALWSARIESVLGHRRRALALLRRAFAEGQGAPARYDLHVSRDVDP
ncbi:MAG: BTAD domain-containing putative transcriptional regulator, partial [Gemmatimonadales bacterium]